VLHAAGYSNIHIKVLPGLHMHSMMQSFVDHRCAPCQWFSAGNSYIINKQKLERTHWTAAIIEMAS
jgi:hypothetical protein